MVVKGTVLGLKALDLSCLLVTLEDDVPTDGDQDEPEQPKIVAGNPEIAAGKVGCVLSDHAPQQRQGHVSVVPGS